MECWAARHYIAGKCLGQLAWNPPLSNVGIFTTYAKGEINWQTEAGKIGTAKQKSRSMCGSLLKLTSI